MTDILNEQYIFFIKAFKLYPMSYKKNDKYIVFNHKNIMLLLESQYHIKSVLGGKIYYGTMNSITM